MSRKKVKMEARWNVSWSDLTISKLMSRQKPCTAIIGEIDECWESR